MYTRSLKERMRTVAGGTGKDTVSRGTGLMLRVVDNVPIVNQQCILTAKTTNVVPGCTECCQQVEGGDPSLLSTDEMHLEG